MLAHIDTAAAGNALRAVNMDSGMILRHIGNTCADRRADVDTFITSDTFIIGVDDTSFLEILKGDHVCT